MSRLQRDPERLDWGFFRLACACAAFALAVGIGVMW